MEELKKRLGIENDRPIPADYKIDYFIHQEDMYHIEVQAKRWFIGWIITFIALVLTNMGWIIYENQFEDVVTTVTQETSSDGGNNIISGDKVGAVINGESEADDNN